MSTTDSNTSKPNLLEDIIEDDIIYAELSDDKHLLIITGEYTSDYLTKDDVAALITKLLEIHSNMTEIR